MDIQKDCFAYGNCDFSLDCNAFCKFYIKRGLVMEKFLKELQELLRKHNATILRSANSSNDLAISVQEAPGEFKELLFSEEISETAIMNEWYS
jgi:hypothetical protein